MRYNLLKLLVILFFAIICIGCWNYPSTADLDADIKYLNNELDVVQNEIEKYSGGLIKTLIHVRKEILTNTKLMLEQKRSGIRRFIPIKYTIDGEKYVPPVNKVELINDLQIELEDLTNKAKELKNKSDRYSGGLIKAMIESQLATVNNSIAMLEQKKVCLKYDIPIFAFFDSTENVSKESEFVPTPGKDIDKF